MKVKMVLVALIGIFVMSGCSLKTSSSMYNSDIERERILKVSKNYDKLITEYKEKLAQTNSDEDRLKLAELYFLANDLNNANYYVNPLFKRGANDNVYLLKAQILERQDKFQEALDILEEGLKVNSRNAEIWNLKGIIFAKNSYFKEAKNSFETAKLLFMDDFKVNTNLGVLEILKGDNAKALTYLKPLYTRGYKNSAFLSSLVYALIKNNELDLAKQVVRNEGLANDFKSVYNAVKKSKVSTI